MLHDRPAPATRPARLAQVHPRRHSLLVVLAALALLGAPVLAHAQLSATGRWTPTSPTRNALGEDNTAIHMTLLRGDDDWATDVTGTRFHSYLFWWENRHELCGSPTKFAGALYGWKPGGNADCTGNMMNAGFTILPLNSELDPGYDVFCAGHTTLKDGRLLVVGGASAENSGVPWTSIFDVRDTVGSRWTELSQMALPRWYPTVKQLSDNTVVAYAGLRYARMHVLGGRDGVGGSLRTQVGRQRLTDTGEWDSDVFPIEDPGVYSGDHHPGRREYATAPVTKVNSGLSRAILFGGKDSAGTGRSDVWWLLHKTDGGGDELEWFKFTGVTGAAPQDGLWKHVSVAVTPTINQVPYTRLWVYGGVDKFNNPNTDVYFGEQNALDTTGRTWNWTRTDPPGGPGERVLASCAYDAKYNRMIVYGGKDAAGVLANNEVYALNLNNVANPTWQQLSWSTAQSSVRPAALAEAGMCAGPSAAEHLSGPSANMYLYGGVDAGGAPRGEVWLMYFPTSDSVSWHKLNVDPTARIPNPRRGPIVLRDTDSWNLRVFGGATANSSTPDTTWMIDVYRNPSNTECDNRPRPWIYQENHDGGAIGAVGFADPFEVPANTVERMTPPEPGASSAPWSNIPNNPERYEHFYPLMFQLPNGKVFNASASRWFRPTFTLDLTTGVWVQFPATQTDSSLWSLEGGSAVSRVLLDRTYEIMKCGSKDQESGAASGLAARIRIAPNGTTTGWSSAGTMAGRVFHNLVTLPNGRVLVTGGANAKDYTASSSNNLPVYIPQIWNPVTNTWSDTTTLARNTTARGYHSTALLMPDGRVLTGGGNDEVVTNLDKHKFGVFCPPYRFSGGAVATAPLILNGPTTLQYNSTFFVTTNDVISQVCLIRPGAVTHGFNPDQHYIELTFLQCDNAFYAFSPTAAYAPPGDYLLFIVNSAGVPSVGKWVRLGNSATVCSGTCPENPCTGGGSGGGGGGGGYYEGDLVAGSLGSMSASAGEVPAPSVSYLDNTLFAGSAEGSIARDRLPLPNGPVATAAGLRVRLRHFGAGQDEYSRVRLIALDHAAGSESVADSVGEYCGTRSNAASLTMANGREALPDIAANGWADGQPGDVMFAELGSGGAGAIWLEASGHVPDEGGIRIEVEQEGQWVEAAVVTPRESRSRSLVTGVSAGRVRLTFLGAHRVHGLGWFHPAFATTQRTELAPLVAHHSREGDLLAGTAIVLGAADTAHVDFATLAPAAEGMVRDWYLEVDGRPLGYKPSAGQLSARHLSRPGARPASTPPLAFQFDGAVPNPFASSTRLSFVLPSGGDVRVEIFDAQGRRVRQMDRYFEAGRQSLDWNRSSESGLMAAPGVYQVRLRAGANVATRSVVVLP